ncbi:MAG: PAS domain S-box protein [Bacteroidetes bacterium]|nr:PAS domain S-box protein [Bacteroidota bacterium]
METIDNEHIAFQHFESAMEAGNIAWWEMEYPTGAVRFHKRKTDMLGRDHEAFRHYTDFTTLLHPDDLEPVMQAMRDHLQGKTPSYLVDYRIKTSTGEYRWFQDIGKISSRDEHGEPLTVSGIVLDITERKQAEERVRYQSQLLAQVNDAVIATDDTFSITYWNECAERMYGWKAEEVLGKRSASVLHPEFDRTNREQALQELVADGKVITSGTQAHKNGTRVYFEASTIAVLNENRRTIGYVSINRDVTERKKTEDAIQESEGKYRSLFNANMDGISIFYINEDETLSPIVNANRSAAAMLGYELDEIIGKHPSEFESEATMEVLNARMVELKNNGTARFETELMHKDGRKIPVEINVTAIPYNKRPALMNIVRDITERKRAECDLRHHANGLIALVNSSRSISTSLDLETVLQRSTDNIIALTDLHSAAIYTVENGTMRLGATSPALPPNFPEQFRHAPLTDHPHIQQAMTTAQTVVIPDAAAADLSPAERSIAEQRGLRSILYLPLIGNGAAIGVLIVARTDEARMLSGSEIDLCRTFASIASIAVENARLYKQLQQELSEHRLAEEALAMSNKRLTLAQRSAGAGVWDWNIHAGTLDWTPELYRLFGLDPATTVASFDVWRNVLHPDDRTMAEERINSSIRDHAPLVSEYRIITPSGEVRWINAFGDTHYDDLGEPLSMSGICIDVTSRKISEEALLNAQKLESIGTLAGGIAHDFNNLMNSVLGQSALALHKLPKESPAASNILKAIKSSERVADLTKQLLAYSGRGKFFIEEIDLNVLVHENIQMLELSISKTTELRLDLCEPAPHIVCDSSQIQQVLMNLIMNGNEAVLPNPGTITIHTDILTLDHESHEYSKFTAIALPAGRYARLKVSDTGCGMTQDTLSRIFDPFFSTKFTGRGLGLAAVLGIVKGHHGGLLITSDVGKGTMFEILLPLAVRSKAIDGPERKAASSIQGNGNTILVIDDEPSVIELLEDMLPAANFAVISSADPVTGIEIFRKQHQQISLVILDFSMPKMSGKSVFEELLKIDSTVKVLLCSGYSEEETMSGFTHHRPAGFFQKPYSTDDLVQKIATIILSEE